MKRIIKAIIKTLLVYVISVCVFIFLNLESTSPLFSGGFLLAYVAIVVGTIIVIANFVYTESKQIVEQINSFADPDNEKEASSTKQHFFGFVNELKEDMFVAIAGCVLSLLLSAVKGISLLSPSGDKTINILRIVCIVIFGAIVNSTLAFLDILASFVRILNLIFYHKVEK